MLYYSVRLLATRRRSVFAERWEDIQDFDKRWTAHAGDRDCLLAAINLSVEMIASWMVYQNRAKRRIVWDWNDFPFFWKVMISRSCDQYSLLFIPKYDLGDRSQLHCRHRFSRHPGNRIHDRMALRDQLIHFPGKAPLDPTHGPKLLLCRLVGSVLA